jgi:hypothetical protein
MKLTGWAAASLAFAAWLVLPALAQDDGDAPATREPASVPAAVDATVDDSELTTTGLFTIRLEFEAEEDVPRPYSVVIDLAYGDRVYLSWDHTPSPPPAKWKKGQKARCDLTAPFPPEAVGAPALDVLVAFRDGVTGRIVPPRGAGMLRMGKAEVAQVRVPEFEPVVGEERIARILAAADALATAGRKPDAWAALEFALRGAPDDVTKYRFRNALAKLGDFAPRPLTEVERRIVDDRIADERRRYLRQAAGRLFDQQKYHGALRILQSIGGSLQEAGDAAVVGALADARRVERDLQDLRERIWERCTPEEKAEAEAVIQKIGRNRAGFEKARSWVKEGRLGVARRVLKDLAVTAPKDVAGEASALVKDVDKAMLAAIPPDEVAASDAALKHPAFDRTAVSLSHEFVFIGPKTLVETIPPGSRLGFDLAYVFVTDLFGRRPNPAGDRVTVYFKELWDFGGGVGGGKIIDIGNAKPDVTGTPVDNPLLFHELVHCVDDTVPIHAGFREGLADFGAAFTAEALARTADAQRAFAAAATAFRKDYVERDLEYWRIPNYGPSAGFFLHFSEKYAKTANGHDWKGWRQFFREYRAAPVRDGREPYVIRAFARYLVRAFGPGAFEDLLAFRFPLVASDLEAVEKEIDKFEGGEPLPGEEGEFAAFPNSPMRRDLAARRAIEALRIGGQDDEVRRIAREELGVLFDWQVIGPFEPQGADPGAQVFPPEHEIDFAKEYPQRMNVARWKKAGDPGPVQIDPLGWVRIEYGYMDDTATYAFTNVVAPADTDAYVHVRADDDFSLFVNGERVNGYVSRGWNDSTRLWWRGPVERAPDAMRLRVRLRQGRNPVLLKIRNRGGAAGFICALSALDGTTIPGLSADLAPPPTTRASADPKWHSAVKAEFRTKGAMKGFEVPVGAFEVANKLLAGTSTAKGVQWRKYTVRPGFPKDAPSNLMWLRANLTEAVDDFRLTVTLAQGASPPKLALTFQGEGGNDGLSGWNLLLWDAGGKVGGQIERYEDLVYQWAPVARETKEPGAKDRGKDRDDEREPDVLVLTHVAQRLTVTFNGAPLVADVPVRVIPGRTRIGLSTWGADPKIASIELETTK